MATSVPDLFLCYPWLILFTLGRRLEKLSNNLLSIWIRDCLDANPVIYLGKAASRVVA